jgi:hypothetical protein
MPAYDSTAFRPPAPVALVKIQSPSSGKSVTNVPMLLDTGADVSLIPDQLVRSLIDSHENLPKYEVEGFDGARSHAPAVALTLEFLGKTFRGKFLLIESNVGIMGRNILNCTSLQFDGPALAWQELPASASLATRSP